MITPAHNTMASEGAELDLYADDIGDEFSQASLTFCFIGIIHVPNVLIFLQENEFNETDLYDDVITSSSKSRTGSNNNAGSGSNITSIEESATSTSSLYNGSTNQNQQTNHSSSSNLLQSHTSSNNEISSMNSSKKPCIYVGNLTWV